MSKDFVVFRDYHKMACPSAEQTKVISDSMLDSYGSTNNQKGLEVTLKATHSAILNLNQRFYLPSRMADGARTFVNKKKPTKILKNHDSHSDPVGIIVGAEYVPTIPEGLMMNRDIQILTDSSNSISKQVSAAKRFMKSGIPFSDGWEGLGYIKLKAVIMDDKAIDQVANGLFDSVSTSFRSPGEAYCSICGQNWAKDGFCEHEPGQVYKDEDEEEGIPCSLIPGYHNYDECSLVVFDADPHTTISIGFNDSLKEWSLPVEDWKSKEVANSNEFVYEFKDYLKEENTMADQTIVELTEQEKAVLQVVKTFHSDMEESAAIELAKSVLAKKQDNGFYPNQEEACIDEETAVLYILEDLATVGQEINSDEVYSEMEKELISAEMSDKVLSAESRNKMSESTFCGPQRSFPVPDCAHVTAARRLIGRYKGPGDKSAILACVSRKAKALGCGETKDTEQQPEDKTTKTTFVMPTCSCLQAVTNDEVQTLFAMTESELIIRNLKVQRECSKCAAHEDSLKQAEVALKDSQSKTKELEVTLRVLREELQRQYADYAAQVDKYIDLGLKLRDAQEEKVAMISVLCGKHSDIATASESLRNTDLVTFEASLNFKLEDAVSKLNDGMTREPKGTVKDPTINTDSDNTKLPEGLSSPAMAAIESIKDLLADGQFAKAKGLYDRMVYRKVLDEKMVSFENLQQRVAE